MYLRTIAAACLTASGVASSGSAAAAAPPNNDWADRTVIATLPYTATVADIAQATSEASDPELYCSFLGGPTAGFGSIWYEFTPAEDRYVDLRASGYDTMISVYEGTPQQGFRVVRGGCNDDDREQPDEGSRVNGLQLRANTRYSIEVVRYEIGTSAPTLSFSIGPSLVYTVTKTQDSNDGTCDADCSLREAAAASNANPGAIVLPAGNYTVPGGLRFWRSGSIYGAGRETTLIDAAGSGRVLSHDTAGPYSFALHDLSLVNGNTADEGGAFAGFGGYYVFDRVALRHSTASQGGGAALMTSASSGSMYESVAEGNTAATKGGGVYVEGYNLEIHESAIVGNQTQARSDTHGGGGIFFNTQADARLVNSTVSGNRTEGAGGGVYLNTRNRAHRGLINNSTITNNGFSAQASSLLQGGLVIDHRVRPDVNVKLSNSVLSGNYAMGNPGQFSDCVQTNFAIAVISYTLAQATTNCAPAGSGNLSGIDPLLLALDTSLAIPAQRPADNSPLLDAGDPAGSCARIDSQGTPRPLDGNGDGAAVCDIGAVELRRDLIFTDGFD